MEETLYLGSLIWHGAIGRIAAAAENYQGAGLLSHVRALSRAYYPQLNAAQTDSLGNYAFQAIQTAREFANAPDTFRPLLSDMSDPRRVIQYAAQNGAVDLSGTVRQFQYTIEYQTQVTDLNTGQVTTRNNVLVIRSQDNLNRQQLYNRAMTRAAEQVTFNSGTDPRKRFQLQGFEVASVNLGFGLPSPT